MKKKIVTLTGIILLLLNTVSGPISVFAETSDDVTRNHSVSDAQDDADDLTAIPNTERTYAEQLDITSKDGKEDVSTRTDDVSEKQDYSSFMKLSNEQQQKIASYFNWNNWQNSPNFEVNSTNQDDGSDGTTFKREGVTNMTVSTGDTIGELRLSNTSFSLQITSIPGFTTTENQFLFANPTKYRLAGKNLDKSVENKLSFFSGNVYRWETYTNIKDNGIGASGIGPNERYGDFRYYSQLDSDFYPEATPITPKITILSNQNGFYELTSRYNATTETPITSTYNHYAFYNIYSILIPQVIKVQYRDIDTGKEIAPEKIYGKGKRLNDSVNITAPNIGEYEFANKWESLSEYADYSQISGSDSGTKSAINTKLTTNERGIVFYYRMARPTGTSITKTADYNTEDKLAQIGDTVKYKVNLSTESLNGEGVKNVTVSDVLPSGMSEPRNIAIDGTKILSSSQTSELPNYEWDKSNHTMIIHLNNFSGNQKSLLTYQSKVLTGTDGEIKTNNIVFSSTDINTGDKYSPKSSWEFKIKQLNPKISIQKNVKNLSNTTSDHYVIGDKLQYKITMTNPEKDSILSDGKIIDDLPKGLSKPSDIILTRPDGQTTKLSIEDIYNEKTQQLVIPIGNLKGGESVTLTYETSIEDGTAGKELINTAKGTGKTPENKVIEESSSQKVIPVNNPSIKVEKSLTDLTSKEATVGDTLSYTIKMSNPTADSELSNGVIRDVLPAGLSAPTHIQLTNASGETSDLSASDVYDASTRTLTIPVGSLQGGQVVKVSFESEIEASAVGQNLVNVAVGEGQRPDGKPMEGSDSQPVTPSNNPSIKVEKSLTDLTSKEATVGDTLSYTIKMSNPTADSELSNGVIRDVLPAGLSAPTYIQLTNVSGETSDLSASDVYDASTRTLTIPVGSLQGGQVVKVSFESEIEASAVGQNLVNVAVGEGQRPDGKPMEGSDSQPVTPSNNPSIKVEKSLTDLTSKEATVGDTLSYTIKMSNPTADSELSNGVIRDVLPAGLSAPTHIQLTNASGETSDLSASDVYDASTRTLTIPVGSLQGGQVVKVSFESEIEASAVGQNLVNVAVGEGQRPDGKPMEGSDSQPVTPSNNPSIKVEKSLTDLTSKEATVGDTLSYTIKMSNPTADSELSNGVIRDVLPAGLSAPTYIQLTNVSGETSDLSASDVYDASTRTLTIPVGSLQGGQVVKVSFESEIEASAVGQNLVNVAVGEGQRPDGKPIEGSDQKEVAILSSSTIPNDRLPEFETTELSHDNKITTCNQQDRENNLPKTGDKDNRKYIIIGFLLLMISLYYLYSRLILKKE